MSGDKLKVRCLGPCSSQEWTADPDMVEFDIPYSILSTAEKAVAFMAENPSIMRVDCHDNVDRKFYSDFSSFDDELPAGVIDFEGQYFAEMTPAYSLESCIVVVDNNGDLSVEIPISDSNDYLWSSLATLDELKTRFADEIPNSLPKHKVGM